MPQAADEGGAQGIAIPGLGGEFDAEILSLLVPATLAVFLDPAMALIDTGTHWRTASQQSVVHVPLHMIVTSCTASLYTRSSCQSSTGLCIPLHMRQKYTPTHDVSTGPVLTWLQSPL